MKVLFLDFDGVLNHRMAFAFALDESDVLDRRCVGVLNEIVDRSRAVVVISSAWRRVHSLEALQRLLERHGFEGEIVDTTPDLPARLRGDEIRAWLDAHPEVTSFAILDDEDHLGELSGSWVRTSFETGLLPEHVAPALALLGAS